jgi:hypothetical protein
MESSHIPKQILTYRPRKRTLGYSLRRENNTLLKKKNGTCHTHIKYIKIRISIFRAFLENGKPEGNRLLLKPKQSSQWLRTGSTFGPYSKYQ